MSAQEQPRRVGKAKLAREANERIAQAAERHRFVARMPLFCECDEPECRELVLISRERFDQIRREPGLYVTAPGHRPEHSQRAASEPDYWLVRRS
jgi:hypothetical protein